MMAGKISKIGFKIKLSTETSEILKQINQSQTIGDSSNEQPNAILADSSTAEQLQKEKVQNVNSKGKDPLDASDAINAIVIDKQSPSGDVNLKLNDEKTSEVNAEHSISSEQATSEDGNESQHDYTNIHYEGELAIYTDPSTKQQHVWSNETNAWCLRSVDNKEESEITDQQSGKCYDNENNSHTSVEEDGSAYVWDEQKKAWFPKIDDDFLAHYQMSYGFSENASTPETQVDDKKTEDAVGEVQDLKRKGPEEPKWFNVTEEENTNVYVSNLPLDIKEEEFVEVMQKCGLIMRDISTQKMKIKLYTKPNSEQLKGDALCTYIKIESVDLALKILDGYMIGNHRIKVQRAKFEMKGNYNPALKPKKRKKDKEKLKKMKEKLFDWRPEKMRGERSKHEKVVIIKNLFEPSLFDSQVELILEYQQDMREECGKCGEVKRVVLYDRHPEGVAQVTMKDAEEADNVVKLINGRWFGKRQLSVEIWDGKTKYKMEETDADINKRLKGWGSFLDDVDKKKTEKEDQKANQIENVDTMPNK